MEPLWWLEISKILNCCLPGSRKPNFCQFPAAFQTVLIGFSFHCRKAWHMGATNSACPSGLFSIGLISARAETGSSLMLSSQPSPILFAAATVSPFYLLFFVSPFLSSDISSYSLACISLPQCCPEQPLFL